MQVFVRGILTLVATFAAIPVVAGNVGFLDSERAIKTVKEGQRQLRILDEWATQKSNEVETMQGRVAELQQQLNAQRTVASTEAIQQIEKELLQAQRVFEDAGRTLQRDFEAKQRELLSQVATRVRDLAGEYAAANGFDAIFMLESQPLIYIAESSVITDAVIRLYDERFPIN
jgi:Skp family chaperone for outer membrane proteins